VVKKVEAAKPAEGGERFDQLVGRLDQVVAALERGDLPLEDALAAFEEGVGLVRRGQARLAEMERRVEVLMRDGTTRPVADPALAPVEEG
jgi:exodeoxyribonuclease VII small subunit